MTATLTTPTTPGEPPKARPRGGWFGPLLLRLHFYAGILVGPFIVIAALSGALYAIAPTIEQGVYQRELHAPITETRLTLAEQITIAQEHVDGEATLSAVRPAPAPGDTTRVMFAADGLGPSESRAVFVDPGTGEIRGDTTVYGTSGSLPLRTWLSTLHRNLHLGEPGRLYSELAASWLGIVVVAGGALWVIRIRKSRAKKDFIRPTRTHTGYRRTFSWHTSVGIWVAVGALFLSATGITWSTYAGANVSNLRAALDWGTPTVTTSLTGASSEGGEHAHHGGSSAAPTGAANPATFDAVLAIAQRANVNTGLVQIIPPKTAGTAWVVQEIQRSYPTEADAVAIDGSTMQVVDRVDFADFSLPAKLATWGIAIHMGTMFGVANQIVMFLVAAGIAAMVVLGYLMWWKRRPTRNHTLVGAPPRRGALGGAPWWGVASVVIGGVLIGLWLPLVGYTLAAFVLVDIVVGAMRRARTRT
ncbi:PepSY domain-containing protein [Microbacterium sp. P26]|uniref:PepSY-associated TM helix domain-containing protein n=1 Tax=Microbacterium TaxID=33882 RepID=UPI00203B4CBF|nr:PepSY domain-containing protein [Microbacterium sp. P26]MCM3500283.1 PepSY domain-containing protein [Microbacterium sp. P26]